MFFVTGSSNAVKHRCELVRFFFSFSKRKEEPRLHGIPMLNFYLGEEDMD